MVETKRYVYLVYTDYEEFHIFSNKDKAKLFIKDYAKKNFPKSTLYGVKHGEVGEEVKYNIKDYIRINDLKPIRKDLK